MTLLLYNRANFLALYNIYLFCTFIKRFKDRRNETQAEEQGCTQPNHYVIVGSCGDHPVYCYALLSAAKQKGQTHCKQNSPRNDEKRKRSE